MCDRCPLNHCRPIIKFLVRQTQCDVVCPLSPVISRRSQDLRSAFWHVSCTFGRAFAAYARIARPPGIIQQPSPCRGTAAARSARFGHWQARHDAPALPRRLRELPTMPGVQWPRAHFNLPVAEGRVHLFESSYCDQSLGDLPLCHSGVGESSPPDSSHHARL